MATTPSSLSSSAPPTMARSWRSGAGAQAAHTTSAHAIDRPQRSEHPTVTCYTVRPNADRQSRALAAGVEEPAVYRRAGEWHDQVGAGVAVECERRPVHAGERVVAADGVVER